MVYYAIMTGWIRSLENNVNRFILQLRGILHFQYAFFNYESSFLHLVGFSEFLYKIFGNGEGDGLLGKQHGVGKRCTVTLVDLNLGLCHFLAL